MPSTRSTLQLLLAALTLLLAAAGCAGSQSADLDIVDAAPPASIEAPLIRVGKCTDPSASMEPGAAAAGLDELASVARELVVADAGQRESREPVPGLHVILRQVSSNSLASRSDELLDIVISPVPGVGEPPDPADFKTFSERNALWREAVDNADAAATAAASERELLLQRLADVELESRGSEIGGCLAALRDSFPVGTEFIAVIVSDLEQVGVPQVRGDFSGVRVIVGHACVTVDRCNDSQTLWRGFFDDMGVRSADFVSIDQLDSQILQLSAAA